MLPRFSTFKSNKLLFALSFLAVVVIFHFCYGLGVLVPTNISWLMDANHDWGTHYLSWYFYRIDAWRFPLGDMENLMYPMGTNVGFTDSIPLLALPFKLIGGILPEDFQYLGFWLFLSHALAAYFTILLFDRLKVKPVFTFMAVVFIAANPVLVYRGMHPALTSHWLFIASIYLYFLDARYASARKVLVYQFVLLMLSALINPYLCFMVLGFTFFTALKLWRYEKTINALYFFAYQIVSVLALLFLWYVVGMILLDGGEDLGVKGAYGLYGLNLNSLFNTFGFSSFLPQLDWVSSHQYEGYAYLGVGMMALLLVAAGYAIFRAFSSRAEGVKSSLHLVGTPLAPLGMLVLLYVLFAVTHVVSYGSNILFTVPIPDKLVELGDIFRASSRFFWIPYYLLFLFGIAVLANSTLKPFLKIGVVALALLVQLYDTKLMLTFRKLSYGTYKPPVDEERWLALMAQFDEVILYPGYQTTNLASHDYQYFCFLAAKARKPINTGYVPRVDNKRMAQLLDSMSVSLESGQLSPKALYITTGAHLSSFLLPYQLGNAKLSLMDKYYYLYSQQRTEKSLASLTKEISTKSQPTLDSVYKALDVKLEFQETPAPGISPGAPIRSNFDKIKTTERFIALGGFAFLDTAANTQGDTVFITLHSAEKNYRSAVSTFQRPDVTAHFKKKFLDNSGFSNYLFTTNVKRGLYQVGIGIKDRNNRWVHQLTDHKVRVNMPEFYPAVLVPAVPIATDITFNLEELKEKGQEVQATGWAFFNGQHATDSEVSIILLKDQKHYLFMADPFRRPDVTAHFNNGKNLDNCGFNTKFLKKGLSAGTYHVYVYIKNKALNREGMLFTGKILKI